MIEKSAEQLQTSEPEFSWSSSRRFWVSLVLVFHLFCVALAPLAVVDPRPGLAVETQQVVAPYSELLYLLHGYRFFAPEPGPSHIVYYEITKGSGETITGHFPDRETIWPRLMYHRWFMLSETVYQHVSETLDKKQLGEWQQEITDEMNSLLETDPRAAESLELQLRRELAEHQRISDMRDLLVTSVGKRLLQRHDGASVELKLVTRVIPPPQDIELGLKLDNERYLPSELTYALGTVYSDSDELETIAPQEETTAPPKSDEGQGGGESKN